jgi:hypothetical protein
MDARENRGLADVTGELDLADFAGCPECGQPAEIWDRRVLGSTDGPIEHVRVRCVAKHVMFMPAEYLARTARTRT